MTAHRKKLIEVALPLKAINDESSLRKRKAPAGYPTTLHKWWAQRPLAACRAVLFASLVDDPDSDPMFGGNEDIAASKRAELFNLIEELVLWENSNNPRVINRARAEIARCVATQKIEEGAFKKDDVLTIRSHLPPGEGKAEGSEKASEIKVPVFEIRQLLAKPEQVNAFLAEHAPPVVDPFCGGGSIPLEAQRLGLRVYASDLNPVPVLITKALIEIPPRFAGSPPVNPEWQKKSANEKAATVWQDAQGLADDVRYYGQWMRDEAANRIGNLYPKITITKATAKERPDLKDYVGRELAIIAWLWARTVASPNPACGGCQVPLVRAFRLSTKKGKEAFVVPILDRERKRYWFEVAVGAPPPGFDPKKGTVIRTGGTCLLTGSPIPFDYIRSEGKADRLGTRLMAIVAETPRGRVYLSPTDEHAAIAEAAAPTGYPDTELPKQALSMRVMLYGMDKHYKLFTKRQLVALTTFTDLVHEARAKAISDARAAWFSSSADDQPLVNGGSGVVAYGDALATYLACVVSRCADYNGVLASWRPKDNAMRSTFAKQSLPMVWDFAEANPLEKSSAGLADSSKVIAKCVGLLPSGQPAHVSQLDATASVGAVSNAFVCTDPPYYDVAVHSLKTGAA